MFGCVSCEIALASRANRIRKSALSASSAGSTFTATARLRRVSRARKTCPIPPAPIGATISYGPRRLPGATDMDQENYRLVRPGHRQRRILTAGACPRMRSLIGVPALLGFNRSIRRQTDRAEELVRSEGFEPTTYSSGGCRSIHLSYGRLMRVDSTVSFRRGNGLIK